MNQAANHFIARHPDEPRSVYCRQWQVIKWTGWSRRVIEDLVATGTLKIVQFPKANGHVGRRLFQTAQVKALIDRHNDNK